MSVELKKLSVVLRLLLACDVSVLDKAKQLSVIIPTERSFSIKDLRSRYDKSVYV